VSGDPDDPDPTLADIEEIETASLERLGRIEEGVATIVEQSGDVPIEIRRLVELLRRSSFSGPLPPPEILEGYKQAYPQAPEIIFDELKQQGAHRRRIESEAISRQEKRADRGQHYALAIVGGVLVVCVVAIFHGVAWAGATLFGTTLAGIVGSFIYGSRRQASNLGGKRTTLDKATDPQPPEIPGQTENP
jgi:uncharacterized membrane protein